MVPVDLRHRKGRPAVRYFSGRQSVVPFPPGDLRRRVSGSLTPQGHGGPRSDDDLLVRRVEV